MRLLDHTLGRAAENLALDEALLLQAESGDADEILRLWEWPELAVVLGSGGKLHDDVDVAACLADSVPILRRSSGGGTVLLGRGCLCFSLVLAFDRDPRLGEVRSSYEYILGRVVEAFDLPGLSLAGISDLALGGYKCSGNAQQRKRTHLLHHGTVLYDFGLAAVSRYLKQPARQPDYRADRPHGDFIRNLDRPREWVVEKLRMAWDSDEDLAEIPSAQVTRLVAEKYSLDAWVNRR